MVCRLIFGLKSKKRIRCLLFIGGICDISTEFRGYRPNGRYINQISRISTKLQIYQPNFENIDRTEDISTKLEIYHREVKHIPVKTFDAILSFR